MKLVKYFTSFLLSILFIVAITSMSFAYQDILTPNFIKNYRYYSKYYGGFVTLNNGKFSKPYISSGIKFAETVNINKYLITRTYYRQPIAIVILRYLGGGNMASYQMDILYQKGNKIIHMKPIDLGRDINFQRIVFIPNKIGTVEAVYYALGPNDPMCCPSKYVTKSFEVDTR